MVRVKDECRQKLNCNNLELMKLCGVVKGSYALLEEALKDGDSYREVLQDRQQHMRLIYGGRIDSSVDLLDEFEPGLLSKIRNDPSSGTCSDNREALCYIILALDEFWKLEPKGKKELEERIGCIKRMYSEYFR